MLLPATEGGLDLIVERYDVDAVVLVPGSGPLAESLELVLLRRLGSPRHAGSARVWDLRAASPEQR